MTFIGNCICGEPGSDGTHEHNEPCGVTYQNPNGAVSTLPCKNHEESYIQAGWLRKGLIPKQVSEQTSQLPLPFIDLDSVERLEIERF